MTAPLITVLGLMADGATGDEAIHEPPEQVARALNAWIGRGYSIGMLSVTSADTAVTVAFDLDEGGRVTVPSVRLVADGAVPDRATWQAFETARRAIIRMGRDGLPLPPDVSGTWKSVVLMFNPEGMQFR